MRKEILEAIEAQKMIEDYVKTSDESYVELISKYFKKKIYTPIFIVDDDPEHCFHTKSFETEEEARKYAEEEFAEYDYILMKSE